MRKDLAAALVAALAGFPIACRSAGSKASAPSAPPKEATVTSTRTVHPDVVKRFCGQPEGPAPVRVKVLKDSAGNIGGYQWVVGIPDTPVYYLDAQGKDYAVFHIFGTDAEKARNQPLIDTLRKAYPIEEPLACP